jgi:hypothetical protein
MDALMNSLGIAAGNAGLLGPMCLLALMPLMYLIMKVALLPCLQSHAFPPSDRPRDPIEGRVQR